MKSTVNVFFPPILFISKQSLPYGVGLNNERDFYVSGNGVFEQYLELPFSIMPHNWYGLLATLAPQLNVAAWLGRRTVCGAPAEKILLKNHSTCLSEACLRIAFKKQARYRLQDCTPVQCFARRGDESVDAHVSVTLSTPTLLGLRRAKFLQPGGHLKGTAYQNLQPRSAKETPSQFIILKIIVSNKNSASKDITPPHSNKAYEITPEGQRSAFEVICNLGSTVHGDEPVQKIVALIVKGPACLRRLLPIFGREAHLRTSLQFEALKPGSCKVDSETLASYLIASTRVTLKACNPFIDDSTDHDFKRRPDHNWSWEGEEIWAAHKSVVLRVDEGEERWVCSSVGRDPRENPQTSGIVRHDTQGATPPEIERGSPCEHRPDIPAERAPEEKTTLISPSKARLTHARGSGLPRARLLPLAGFESLPPAQACSSAAPNFWTVFSGISRFPPSLHSDAAHSSYHFALTGADQNLSTLLIDRVAARQLSLPRRRLVNDFRHVASCVHLEFVRHSVNANTHMENTMRGGRSVYITYPTNTKNTGRNRAGIRLPTNSGQMMPAHCLMSEAARWKYGLAADYEKYGPESEPVKASLQVSGYAAAGWRQDAGPAAAGWRQDAGLWQMDGGKMPALRRLDVITMPDLQRHDVQK
ncbi:hypothetical protein PR048_031363 [Dryococelus australis]|uniref:Uncharacterized protein n=1 Tax=Dryococelus australis TaxID=614101 RepID=A0ABQ9G522_9NEOP|nr:hypothetical protein PR048_031363 [Dryococelus australis]